MVTLHITEVDVLTYLRSISDPPFRTCNSPAYEVTLVLICIVGFQTSGFTRDEPKPFIAWPKVRRKRKVIHRRVIVDADGNERVEEVEAEQTAAAASRRSRRTRKED